MKKLPTVSELGGIRAILGYAGNLLIGVALVVAPFIINGGQSPFYPAKQFHPTVEIHDEPGVLHQDHVKAELEKLTFRQPTHIAVVDVNSSRVQNLEQEVQNYARTHPTDVPWISWTDSEHWADNVFVIAGAPNANYDESLEGQVAGYYYGSQLHISEKGREEVWDVAEWKIISDDDDGRVIESAEVASEYIGYQLDPARMCAQFTLFFIFFIAANKWIRYYLGRGKRAMAGIEEAREAYSQAMAGRAAVIGYLRLIPAGDIYGVQVIARYKVLQRHYRRLERAWKIIGDPVGLQWYGMRRGRLAEYAKSYSVQLRAMQQTVVNCAQLLTRKGAWQESWENEYELVQRDIAAVARIFSYVPKEHESFSHEALKWVKLKRAELDATATKVLTRTMPPSDALRELTRLSTEAKKFAEQAVDELFRGKSSREYYEKYRKYLLRYREESRQGLKSATKPPSRPQFRVGAHGVYYVTPSKSADEGHEFSNVSVTVRMNPQSPAASFVALRTDTPGPMSVYSPVRDISDAYFYAIAMPAVDEKFKAKKKRKGGLRRT
ncbi:DUF5129 domain-containing protein [Actinomyces sp. oral taxon 171 str. F0337]|nr:DUF5129 domain-containing protein [Actinomyces sp. oral taxon 171 str. F0337]